MSDGKWRTLREIARTAEIAETGVSARLRDFRKMEYGSYTVQKRRSNTEYGLWEYRLVV